MRTPIAPTRATRLIVAGCALLWVQGTALAATYEAVRLNGGQPIITQAMFTALGAESDGENINGPSVLRVPAWIAPTQRPDPNAQYYLYFAHHTGNYIRMAWAEQLEGPWQLYNIGSASGGGTTVGKGVLDLDLGTEPDAVDLGNSLRIYDHIASPDVFVDNANQRIVMYFHGPTMHGETGKGQKTFVATSADGLNFNLPAEGGQAGHGIQPVMLGIYYFRVFEYSGARYAISNHGWLYQALDANDPWSPPPGFDYGQELWTRRQDNPFQDYIDADPDPSLLAVRHSAVRVVGDTLEVFHSRIGDTPERILYCTIDLGVGGMDDWDPTYPPKEILRSELDWEGVNDPLLPSQSGAAPEDVHQLRDPCLFEDTDGELYLFYAGRGEDALGLARLTVVPDPVYELSIEASPDQISTGASATVTATLVDVARNRAPVADTTIQFSSNAAKNQGYVDPTSAITDSSGTATTTFYSQNRTGVVTVTATGPDGTLANTTITITKGGDEEPPPSGSIQGTVYVAGKPARRLPVVLEDLLGNTWTTTTNPKGKYTFDNVAAGDYVVSAEKDGLTDSVAVVMPFPEQPITGVDLHLQ